MFGLYPQWPEHGPHLVRSHGLHHQTNVCFPRHLPCDVRILGLLLHYQFMSGLLYNDVNSEKEAFVLRLFTRTILQRTPNPKCQSKWNLEPKENLGVLPTSFCSSGKGFRAHAGTSAFLGLIMYQMPKRYLNISCFSLGIEKLLLWKNECLCEFSLSVCVI